MSDDMKNGMKFIVHGIKIERSDLQIIKSGELTPQIINAYFRCFRDRLAIEGVYILDALLYNEIEEAYELEDREEQRINLIEMIEKYKVNCCSSYYILLLNDMYRYLGHILA